MHLKYAMMSWPKMQNTKTWQNISHFLIAKVPSEDVHRYRDICEFKGFYSHALQYLEFEVNSRTIKHDEFLEFLER